MRGEGEVANVLMRRNDLFDLGLEDKAVFGGFRDWWEWDWENEEKAKAAIAVAVAATAGLTKCIMSPLLLFQRLFF